VQRLGQRLATDGRVGHPHRSGEPRRGAFTYWLAGAQSWQVLAHDLIGEAVVDRLLERRALPEEMAGDEPERLLAGQADAAEAVRRHPLGRFRRHRNG